VIAVTCEDCRKALDAAFDSGDAPDTWLRQHLDGCAACNAYQAELDGLDMLLHRPPAIEEDAALVARIQANLARPQMPAISPLMGLAAALALAVASLAGGWALDRYVAVPELSLVAWQPDEAPVLDWAVLRSEVAALPGQVRMEAARAAAGLEGLWSRAGDGVGAWPAGNPLLFWGGCAAGLLILILIDSREARRASGPGAFAK